MSLQPHPSVQTLQLGRLTVGARLGIGGFGVVHKATLEGIGLTFAVKLLNPSPFNEDLAAATKRFFREAEVLFRLRHEFIVPIYGVGEHEGRPYILMEYFNGMNLAEARDKHGQPSPESVLPFIERAAAALSYAHRLGVVHRDIKPQNLMTIKGDARVLDFGVAGLVDPAGQRFTRTADAVGGDAYSAPELSDNGKLIDPRCDIYSLGACWYWLLTGLTPRGVNWESNLRKSAATVTQPYERVVLRCLEQVERRYATADELLKDVQALSRGDEPAQSPHELNDDEARVLGVIVGACPTPADHVSFFKIEQELGDRQTRLRSSVGMRGLRARQFIEEAVEPGDFGDPTMVYKPSDAGFTWASRHVARLDELLKPVPRAPVSFDDEIPF